MYLPALLGNLSVGYAIFTLSVPQRAIGKAKVLGSSKPALLLTEVSFGAFYPAEVSTKDKIGVHWFPRPVATYLAGYAIFLEFAPWFFVPILYLFTLLIKMPVYDTPKLLKRLIPNGKGPSDSSTTLVDEGKWPLVIFSHGLGGTRTAYSQFCANLASEGYVVLCLEHRDLSGPMIVVPSKEQGTTEALAYRTIKEVEWAAGEHPNVEFPWKVEQLEFRRNEIYEMLKAFSQAVSGRKHEIVCVGRGTFDWDGWMDQVECSKDIIMSGHSFGAATTLSVVSQPPPKGFTQLPISHVVALDPWVGPFGANGPLPLPIDLDKSSRPPLCVIASEQFTIWDEHWERLKEIVKAWKLEKTPAHLTTIVRSFHQEFSDFWLIPPARNKRRKQVLSSIHETVMKFIQDCLDAELRDKGKVMEIEQLEKKRKRIKGKSGELFVHV